MLRHYRCSRCFITTLSSRMEVWCPKEGCSGLLILANLTGDEIDETLKMAWIEAFDNGVIIDALMDEINAYLAQTDDV